MSALATALLAAAAYAQWRIPFHTASAVRATLTRGVLAVVGIALGTVIAASDPGDRTDEFVLFALAFGLVHLPAAVILFLKRTASSGKS